MKKYYLIALFLTLSYCAYAQTNNQRGNPDFSGLNPPMNQPKFEITVTGETAYRIIINDIPLLTTAKLGTIKFPANSAIVSNGQQQIRVEKQGSNVKDKSLSVSVGQSGVSTILWKSDLNSKTKEEGVFQAAIPYKLQGWSKSESVNKDDQVRIEKASLWFKQMSSYLESGKGEAFMNRLVGAELSTFHANYLTKDMAVKYHNGWKNYINKGGLKIADLKTARIEVVGNGKLIHLVNATGEGALAILHGNRKTVFDIFLHFPKGKAEPEAILFNLVEY